MNGHMANNEEPRTCNISGCKKAASETIYWTPKVLSMNTLKFQACGQHIPRIEEILEYIT